MRWVLMVTSVLCVLVLFTSYSDGKTIVVDDDGGGWADFTTIQDAINGSDDNDTIRVFPGEYHEIRINKSLSIIGNGSFNTKIVDTGNSQYPFVIDLRSSHVNISNFELIGNYQQNHSYGIDAEITVNFIENITISNCIFNNCTRGMDIGNFRDFVVFNCTFINISRTGIHSGSDGDYLSIQSCSFVNKQDFTSIYISSSCNVTITDSQFISEVVSTSRECLSIRRTDNVTIRDCTFINHTNNSIYIEASSNIVIQLCEFRNNSGYAIYLDDSVGCQIDHNAFYNNGVDSQVIDDGQNSWDDGAEGNYWDDYDGVDLDKDQVGDTPYEIDPDNETIDRFPLMWDPTIQYPQSISLDIALDSESPLEGAILTIFCKITSSSEYPYASLFLYVSNEIVEELRYVITKGDSCWTFQWTAVKGTYSILVMLGDPINISDSVVVEVNVKASSDSASSIPNFGYVILSLMTVLLIMIRKHS